MAYNVLAGGFRDYDSSEVVPERLELITKAIKSVGADLVGLVDVFRWKEKYSEAELKKRFGYKNVYSIDLTDKIIHGGYMGITVMTNLEVKKFETINIGQTQAIKTRTKELDIFTIYLDHWSEETRLKEVTDILKQVDSQKLTVIMGDFNSMDMASAGAGQKMVVWGVSQFFPEESKRKVIKDMGRGEVVKLIKNYGLVDADNKNVLTFPSEFFRVKTPGAIFKIDYAFVSKNVKVKNHQVLKGGIWEKSSDHYPIVIEI